MYRIHHAHIAILGYIQCSLDNTQRQEGHSFGFWLLRMTLKSENEMNDIRHFFRFVPKPWMLNQVTWIIFSEWLLYLFTHDSQCRMRMKRLFIDLMTDFCLKESVCLCADDVVHAQTEKCKTLYLSLQYWILHLNATLNTSLSWDLYVLDFRSWN